MELVMMRFYYVVYILIQLLRVTTMCYSEGEPESWETIDDSFFVKNDLFMDDLKLQMAVGAPYQPYPLRYIITTDKSLDEEIET